MSLAASVGLLRVRHELQGKTALVFPGDIASLRLPCRPKRKQDCCKVQERLQLATFISRGRSLLCHPHCFQQRLASHVSQSNRSKRAESAQPNRSRNSVIDHAQYDAMQFSSAQSVRSVLSNAPVSGFEEQQIASTPGHEELSRNSQP